MYWKMLEQKISERGEGDAGQNAISRNEYSDAWIRRADAIIMRKLPRNESSDEWIRREGPYSTRLTKGLDGALNGRGEVVTIITRNGIKIGESKGVFKDGLLNGQSESVYYYVNGNRSMEMRGIFKNGALNGRGEVVFYDMDGNVRRKVEGTFTDGKLTG